MDAAPEDAAAAIASSWIAAAPCIIEVLDWHKGLHGCEPGCLERMEIVAEYGAGPYGAAVFFPEPP